MVLIRYAQGMDVTEALLDSWRRQCRIVDNVASRFTPELLQAKPAPSGRDCAYHLAHIAEVRLGWLANAIGQDVPDAPRLFWQEGDAWAWSHDLEFLRGALKFSEEAAAAWVEKALADGTQKAGNYDHPVLYLQHMVWHDGWHVGLLMLALRLAGAEPEESWEDENVWDLWRLPG